MPTDVSSSPIFIYFGVFFGILVLAATAVPRILGPLGTAFADWTKQRRRVATETDDARVSDMLVDIEYLNAEIARVKGVIRTLNELIRVHEEWDRELIRTYLDSVPGAPIPTPPKLDYP